MKIRVDACWGGGDHYYFRLAIPGELVLGGGREVVYGDTWDRKTASKALDLLEHVYGVDRRRVRFVVS